MTQSTNNNSPLLCTADVFKENNKGLWEYAKNICLKTITDIWALWLEKKRKKKQMRNFTDFWITSVPTYSIDAQKAP